MLASSIPVKFPIPFANNAGLSFIRPVPVASQIGINPGAASDTDGFVPLNFLVPSAGGIPPDGRDFNGLFNQITGWSQWQAAAAPVYYDAAFSTAIGGYPHGALLNAVGVDTGYWFSTVDNNTSDPDTGGANWLFCLIGQAALDARYLRLPPATTFFVSTTGSDTSGNGSSALPWATPQHAVNEISVFNFGGQTVTIQLATPGTYAGPIIINGLSSGTTVIKGNPASQSSYVISGNAPLLGGLVVATGGSTIELIGLTLANQATGTRENLGVSDATCTIQNVTFAGVAGSSGHVVGTQGGNINIGSGCIFSQSAATCINAENGSVIIIFANMTTSGTPAWSTACAQASNLGSIAFGGGGGWVFTNTGATGPRYLAAVGGVINTGNANFFAGNSAGSPTFGTLDPTGGISV